MAFRDKQTSLAKCTGYFYEGKEITLTRRKGMKHKAVKKYKYDFWPTEKVIEVATVFAVVKDKSKTAQITGVPVHAITKFQKNPMFDNIVSKVYQQKNEELDTYLTDIIHKAAEVIKDRLENGETIVTKDGKIIEKPMTARDATQVLGTTFDKRQLLRGEATSRSETNTGGDRLKDLQARFESLARSKGINPQHEPIEAKEGDDYVNVSGAGEGETAESEASSEGKEASEGQIS